MATAEEQAIRARKRAGAPTGFRGNTLLDPGEKCIEAGAEDPKTLEQLARLTPEELQNMPEHGGKYQLVPCLGVITDLELLRRIWVIPFLESVVKLGTKGGGCRESGVAATTVDTWLERSPQFARMFELAKEQHLDRVEESLSVSAVDGRDEPVFQQGMQVGVIRKYSVPAAIAILKNRRYRDERVVVLGEANKPVQHQHLHLHAGLGGQAAHLDVMAERILDARRRNTDPLGPEVDDEILNHDDAK